ncbi:uncharacterized protein EHS24_003815 [Apiotrichum porosum]|uniref:Uncharacterized protein n=1 Tax=Apiotrichum porosum TaxID=105984 RepID=A0A427XDI0_9TREE|nr:uncharacterized protein EHS24_003815 [Apiotrichum porosum]RSH76882.1 hypothetical protein EHS24_003815 [Apiotrichum porosum]
MFAQGTANETRSGQTTLRILDQFRNSIRARQVSLAALCNGEWCNAVHIDGRVAKTLAFGLPVQLTSRPSILNLASSPLGLFLGMSIRALQLSGIDLARTPPCPTALAQGDDEGAEPKSSDSNVQPDAPAADQRTSDGPSGSSTVPMTRQHPGSSSTTTARPEDQIATLPTPPPSPSGLNITGRAVDCFCGTAPHPLRFLPLGSDHSSKTARIRLGPERGKGAIWSAYDATVETDTASYAGLVWKEHIPLFVPTEEESRHVK